MVYIQTLTLLKAFGYSLAELWPRSWMIKLWLVVCTLVNFLNLYFALSWVFYNGGGDYVVT